MHDVACYELTCGTELNEDTRSSATGVQMTDHVAPYPTKRLRSRGISTYVCTPWHKVKSTDEDDYVQSQVGSTALTTLKKDGMIRR